MSKIIKKPVAKEAAVGAKPKKPAILISEKKVITAVVGAATRAEKSRQVELSSAVIKSKHTESASSVLTKQATLIMLLQRDGGATIDEMVAATGWQKHSVHGTISGALKKRLGLPVTSVYGAHGRSYRIVDLASKQ